MKDLRREEGLGMPSPSLLAAAASRTPEETGERRLTFSGFLAIWQRRGAKRSKISAWSTP